MNDEENNIVNASEDGAEASEKLNYGFVPASILAGLVGLAAALIIVSICAAVSGGDRYFPYILFPLCICLFTKLFSAHTGIAGILITALFSVIGLFITPAFSYAINYCIKEEIFFLSSPLVAFSSLAEHNFFTDIALSADTVFPAAFIVIGILITYQIYRYFTFIKND